MAVASIPRSLDACHMAVGHERFETPSHPDIHQCTIAVLIKTQLRLYIVAVPCDVRGYDMLCGGVVGVRNPEESQQINPITEVYSAMPLYSLPYV
jgi:hypothetical protein